MKLLMAEYRKNKKVSNFLYSKPVLVILAIIAIFFAINIADIAKKSVETRRNKDIALAKVADLEEKEAKLSADIAVLGTPEGTESAIREKFRVVKPGEGLVVILDDKDVSATVAPPQEKGFWSFIKRLFTREGK